MIDFITIKSSLVPLIEGLCAQLYSRKKFLILRTFLCNFCDLRQDRIPGSQNPKFKRTRGVLIVVYPKRCKTSSVGQSAGLLILRSSVSFRQKLKKTENSNLHGFEVHRPSSKGTKLLLQVIKAIITHFNERTLIYM